MLPVLPLGADGAWGPTLYTNTIKSSFGSPLSHPHVSVLLFPSSLIQVVDWGIISSLLACLSEASHHRTPNPHKWSFLTNCCGMYRGEEKERGWRLNVLNVSHICACHGGSETERGGVIRVALSQSRAANKSCRMTNYRDRLVELFLWQTVLPWQTMWAEMRFTLCNTKLLRNTELQFAV